MSDIWGVEWVLDEANQAQNNSDNKIGKEWIKKHIKKPIIIN